MTFQDVVVDRQFVLQAAAVICLGWSVFVFVVQIVGVLQLFRFFSRPASPPVSPTLPSDQIPHITVIRPIKGWESAWYECLASSFRQSYPRDRMTVCLCVASADDPSYPFLQRLLNEHPGFDAHILVEEEDPVLHGLGGKVDNLGPNPKIRNISRAYREAKGDVIWIVDANVWISEGVAGRMVDKLHGFGADGQRARPFKFVHQLPLVVDIPSSTPTPTSLWSTWGGRLDEMFMSTTHAKFYSAINSLGVAPCVLGKSNMFRKSHLEKCTDPAQNPILSSWEVSRGRGIDFFSSYICEDHLIGDLLWKSSLPGFSNHGLVFGDLAIQPTTLMSVSDYIARRVRWLRVRKWTVIAATLVEPGVESLLCCLYFSFAVTTLPFFSWLLPQTWTAMFAVWAMSVTIWMLLDRLTSSLLMQSRSVDVNENTPTYAKGVGRPGGEPPRPFLSWLMAWIGRETLALPIWTWAVLLGTTVVWRGKKFTVTMDMRAIEIPTGESRVTVPETVPLMNGSGSVSGSSRRSKDRVE
ncbi:glycosyltransferase family 21 protein [Coniochaeta sp. 2T2.1]|nr:glycosyltransferase family 21 protein [Coniochaeta sp. 2T2.1]